jgi:hypothetical protein
MQLKADAQKFQAQHVLNAKLEEMKAAAKHRETQLQLELQASNDQRDGQREQYKAENAARLEAARLEYQASEAAAKLEFERYAADLDASVKIQIEQMRQQPIADNSGLLATIQELQDAFAAQANAPRKLIRGPDGLATALDVGGVIKPIKRGADGRIEGI